MPVDPPVPIGLDEVASVFSDRAVALIAANSGLPLGTGSQAALGQLADDVRASIRAYLVAKCRPTPNTVRREIEVLARAAEARNYEKLALLLDVVSGHARHLLQRRADNSRHMVELQARARQRMLTRTGRLFRLPDQVLMLPTPADLRDPMRRDSACDAIFRLAVIGRGRDWDWSVSDHEGATGELVVPDDGRRHDQRRLRLNATSATRAEPRREAERELFMWLDLDCYVATGRSPPTTARYGAAGPFDRFIAECFRLARVSEQDDRRCGLAVQLRNDRAPLRKRSARSQQLRALLGPCRARYEVVDEVRRLLELGKAKVLRVPIGADDGGAPPDPAVIEFEGNGTVCFWHPPFGYRTIAIEPPLRKQIMELAVRFDP